jgi:hypothetical protein
MEHGASIHSKRPTRKGLLAAAVVCCAVSACSAPEYSSPAWSGRVIERNDGAPVEGAIVVVRWQLEGFDSKFAGWLLMDEAVSDKDGVFHFKSWGPMRTPDNRGSLTRMSPNVPEISVFKPGYEVEGSGGGSDSGYLDDRFYTGPSERKVYADDHVIAMDRFHGTVNEYRDYLEHNYPLAGPACGFMETPQIYAAAIRENDRLRHELNQGLEYLNMRRFEEEATAAHCGVTVQFKVSGYLK